MTDANQSAFIRELQRYSSYLRLLAEMQLGKDLRGKVDLSGLVQQTLVEACQAAQLSAETAERLRAWLREALTNNLRDEIRRLKRDKRDVRREILLSDLESSSLRLEGLVAGSATAPDANALHAERMLQVAQAIDELPAAQREAIVLHHLQQWTVAEVAGRLGRTEVAVAGLLKRGFKSLRENLNRNGEE